MSELTTNELTRTQTIAQLNDRARESKDRTCRAVFTRNLLGKLGDLSMEANMVAQRRIMLAMRDCTFAKDSPERDLAFFEVGDHHVMMKIDYYDKTLEWGSDDPADPSITRRVITLRAPEDN